MSRCTSVCGLLMLLFPALVIAAEPPAAQDGVSFSADLAEILLDRCSRCHGGRLPRRQLRIESYATLMRGSAERSVVEPGDPANSLMIRKLKGQADGDQMPSEGQLFSAELIRKFEAWIRQGARFDGSDPELPFPKLVAASKRDRLDANELGKQAIRRAQARWALAFPGKHPEIHQTEHFLWVTRPSLKDALPPLSQQTEKAFNKTARWLLRSDVTIKSPLTIYVIRGRYEHAEFLEMVERRSASALTFHWRPDDGFGYAVIGPSSQAKDTLPSAAVLQRLVSNLLLNRWQAPTWYAEGVGQVFFEQSERRHWQVRMWQAKAPAALVEAKTAEDLFLGRLPRQAADAATWAFAKYLATDQRRMRQLHASLAEGQPFEPAFRSAYGKPPDAVCQAWLDQYRGKRRGGRR